MARIRRVERDSQCPRRGIGLFHTTDGTPECVDCGQITTRMLAGEKRVSDSAPDPEPALPPVPDGQFDFTEKQMNDLVFLRWLRREGRI